MADISIDIQKAAIEYGKNNNRETFSYYNNELDLENAFIAGAMSPEAAKFHDQMRWVKASEELPPKSKMPYFVKMGESRRPGTLYPEYFSKFDVIEWLYEPPIE